MPMSVDSSRFRNWSTAFLEGEWLARAIDDSIAVINAGLEVPVDTGQMAAAFANVVPAQGTGLDRAGGIGNMAMVGEPTAKPPADTITNFMKWYGKNA